MTPHLESTVAALAFNHVAQEDSDTHACMPSTYTEETL